MMLVWTRIAQTLQDHGATVLVTVLDVAGSGPREAGARMIVTPGGHVHGTVGGGALEWQALAEAQAMLTRLQRQAIRRDYALGPDLGQCCGGRVTLLFEAFGKADLGQVREFAERERAGGFWLFLQNDGEEPRRGIAGDDDPALADMRGHVLVQSRTSILLRFGGEATPVHIFGAGHVGRATMLALAQLPFQVTLIDSRSDALPRAVPGNCALCLSENPARELAGAPDGAFILIMTHSHALDQDLTLAALSQDRFAYVGLIGSATKRARFTKRLREAGVNNAAIDALVCPVGLDTIKSKEPAAIAISIAAQLLERREALAQANRPAGCSMETRHAAS